MKIPSAATPAAGNASDPILQSSDLPNWVYSLDWSSQDAKLDLILFTINFGKIVTDLGVMVLLNS